ncbi:MAG: 16S rRNA (adenine(1518)-N(6)/adenine(1519)-N(6))-dimethyltransferase RsmA [Lachnospiraceae bacterium]|nr:16S rRNA (adenine(1518)-N(6)/adenine(1519)-N(6))-dimethyltransferase RsmA [Lachnospiraceae bacterium]
MEKLIYPQNTIEVIRRYGFVFQKKYGQNFLIDPRVADRILEAAKLTGSTCVLEIGPGIGTLTQYLAEEAGYVIAVEIDRELIPVLHETLAPYENVAILNEDILKCDIPGLIGTYAKGKQMQVVANLPYYITTPVIMSLLEQHLPVERITVMVQKEVADRMQASPGTKDYGALSLAVQYYAKPEIVANVPPNCFMPRPKVGSAVITLDCTARPDIRVEDEAQMFSLIHAAFGQRRKMLPNAIGNAPGSPFTKEQATAALGALGIPETIRGEKLSLQEFALLSDELGKMREEIRT